MLGNGDIKTPQDAIRMWRMTGCAGIMIARGSFGQPWIFDQTRDLLEGRPMRPDPAVEQRFAIALDHARMANDYEPDRKGAAIEFRKHLGWYCKGLPGSAELRKKLHSVESLGEVEGIFADYLQFRDRYVSAGRARRDRAAGDRRGMKRTRVRDLLEQVATGALDVTQAMDALTFEPEDVAAIRHHRSRSRAPRRAFQKSYTAPARRLSRSRRSRCASRHAAKGLLVTRLSPEAAEHLRAAIPAVAAERRRTHGVFARRATSGARHGHRRHRHCRHERSARRRRSGRDARRRWATA